jgi:hypothetical protein
MAVSLLQQILDGSILSRQRLMEARDHYAPQPGGAAPEQAFARWTERVALQSELGGARELAGLADDELAALESEFARFPVRRRTDPFRHAFRIAAVLAGLGGIGLTVQALAGGFGDGGYRVLQVLCIASVLAGVCAVIVGAYVAFSMLHLELSHGTVGLYVGRLDEQHPWLYEAVKAARNPAAAAYRCRVLSERGPLRGADWVIMREIIRAQEVLERTQWARTLAHELQCVAPASAEAVTPPEPRLVAVSSAR